MDFLVMVRTKPYCLSVGLSMTKAAVTEGAISCPAKGKGQDWWD